MLQFWDKRLAQANMLNAMYKISREAARAPTQSVLPNDTSGQGQSTNPMDHHVMMVKHLWRLKTGMIRSNQKSPILDNTNDDNSRFHHRRLTKKIMPCDQH